MRTIALLAVMAMLLVDLIGTRSSVGGPMTMMLVVFLAMLAIGFYEAWSEKRGPLGWIVSIVASIIGGILGVSAGSMAMEKILSLAHFEGALASSRPRVIICLCFVRRHGDPHGAWIMDHVTDRKPVSTNSGERPKVMNPMPGGLQITQGKCLP